jgi:hypothetical protein
MIQILRIVHRKKEMEDFYMERKRLCLRIAHLMDVVVVEMEDVCGIVVHHSRLIIVHLKIANVMERVELFGVTWEQHQE